MFSFLANEAATMLVVKYNALEYLKLPLLNNLHGGFDVFRFKGNYRGFDEVQGEAVQEIDLHPDPKGVQEYTVK